MADYSNFVSQRQINAEKQQRRRAREEILRQAKAEYEKEERRRVRKKASGEDTWMLPSLSKRIEEDEYTERMKKVKKDKSKKTKKHKKEKKKRKIEKKNFDSNSSNSDEEDEWVEKTCVLSPDANKTSLQRDSWMLCPPVSCSNTKFDKDEASVSEVIEESMNKEESDESKIKALSSIDRPGQHPRELNPFWKDGGVGLPSEKVFDESENQVSGGETLSKAGNSTWLKKALQRAKEQAEEEGTTLEKVAAKRWGSLQTLYSMIATAEEREEKERQDVAKNDMRRTKDLDEHWGHRCGVDKHRSFGKMEGSKRNKKRDGYSDRDRSRDFHRDQDRDRGIERDRSIKINKERDREQDRLKDSDSDREQNREKRRDKDNDMSKDVDEHKRIEDERRSNRKESKIEGKPAAQLERHEERKYKPSKSGFLRPSEDVERSLTTSNKFMRPPSDVSSTSCHPSSWDFSNKTGEERPNNSQAFRPGGRSAGSWRKMTASETNTGRSSKKKSDVLSSESEESESVEDEDVEMVEMDPTVPDKLITETDLNALGAKIMRAELMGNEEMAEKLRSDLEIMRKHKDIQEAKEGSKLSSIRKKEEILLTRTDKFGNVRPVESNVPREPRGGRRKKQMVSSHNKEGKRERYFGDDDDYDLAKIVRKEKMNTTEDSDSMFSQLSSKAAGRTYSQNFTLDDHFVSSAVNKFTPAQQEERERQRAIAEHKRISAALSKCRFCIDNPEIAKHLIIAIGLKVYLAVPLYQSLTTGHCLIIPMEHVTSSLIVDEDVWSEIQIYKKGLTKMFEEMEEDVVFLETHKNIRRQQHMVIECVPLPKDVSDMAPIYFKKAILESDTEWAQNKKLIDTSKKGLRGSIPKGLPFFNVEFGLDGGFAHIIEEEDLFPFYFGKEILGGMLDLEPQRWRKPRRENFEEHKKKVLEFSDWWKPFDWTTRIKKE